MQDIISSFWDSYSWIIIPFLFFGTSISRQWMSNQRLIQKMGFEKALWQRLSLPLVGIFFSFFRLYRLTIRSEVLQPQAAFLIATLILVVMGAIGAYMWHSTFRAARKMNLVLS